MGHEEEVGTENGIFCVSDRGRVAPATFHSTTMKGKKNTPEKEAESLRDPLGTAYGGRQRLSAFAGVSFRARG